LSKDRATVEKKILLAMVLTVAMAILLTVYWLLEPRRVKVEAEEARLEAVQKGKELYLTHCARCHGETGGPQRGIKAINSKTYLEAVDDTLLYKIIDRGIPRTGMVALGDREGGPLNPEQVHQLVAFIRNWERTAPVLPEGETPKERPIFIQEEVAYVGSESCIGCHEDLNKKHVDTWRKSTMTLKAFASIQGEKDKAKCTPCHATGYDPEKKTYKEKNVGCEACHGPGEKYQDLMMGKDAREGGKIARENALKSCTRCHHPHVEKEEHVAMARKGLLAYP
jgi:mono/diheme cytochrome c family protein